MNNLLKQLSTNRINRTLHRAMGLLLITLLWSTSGATAASPPPQQQVAEIEYTVQSGDTLHLIALRYNLNPIQIALANDLTNPNLIFPGQTLTLPGVENSPTIEAPSTSNDSVHVVQPGETIVSIANRHNVSVNHLIIFNQLINPDVIQIGQILNIPDGPLPTPGPLTPPFENIDLSEPTIIQGRTLVITVNLSEPVTLSGTFEARPIIFYENESGQYWGLVPIHALQGANSYPIILTATLPNGQTVTTFENVTVTEGPYGFENIQLDDERLKLLDADLIQIEREKLLNVWSQVSLQPRWEGNFGYPVAVDTLRITSNFGTRRTYNDSEGLSFHGGTDFGGGTGTPIFAPAAGTIVLAQKLTVRGNAVVIDHGLGLHSNYWHQSRIVVTEGQIVQRGDLIGYIGNTGLVTGPHLHWELRLNGIAVDPLQWIQESIP